MINIATLVDFMDNLHPIIHNYLQKQRERMRNSKSSGEFANFREGDYVSQGRNSMREKNVAFVCVAHDGFYKHPAIMSSE